LEERASVKLALLCPVCRSRKAVLRYSRKDTAYVVCSCGVRIFVWDTEAEGLMLKRVKAYEDAKTEGRLEKYKKSQVAVR
jgi:DNA-directed RNA polymerase subunit RPC12/RpoP